MGLPLTGVRIVEMGQLIAIPHAIKLLGDMGAEVIRIESCGRLDNYRTHSLYGNSAEGRHWDRAANFYEQNRNKRSLTLDLTNEACLGALRDLVSVSDVFAENFTPRVMRNFGLEYDDLRKVKPDIVMVSSTGYGYTGPWSDYGAIGFTTEATSGLAHMTGYRDGPPVLPEIPYADYTAAEHTAFAIMAALAHRERTGQGQFIDVSQSETLTSTIPEAILDWSVNGRVADRMGNSDGVMSPHGCYPCKGRDRWIAIAVGSDAEWQGLCEALGKGEWLRDARFADGVGRWEHRAALDALVGAATSGWEQGRLQDALQGAGVAAGAVLDGKGLLFDEHLMARGFYEVARHEEATGMPPLPYTSRPWRFSETPGGVRWAAPTLGRDNRFVLQEALGMGEGEVDGLEEVGAIGSEPTRAGAARVVPVGEQIRRGMIVGNEGDYRERVGEAYPDR